MEGKPAAGYNIRQSTVFIKELVEIQIIIPYNKLDIDIRKLFLDIWCIFFIQVRSVYKELHADHETGAADNKTG